MGEPSFKDSDNDFVGNVGEEIEDKETEEVDVKEKRLVGYQTIWTEKRLAQIKECQLELFGREQPEREYKLNNKAQRIILKHYEDKNPEFKEAVKNYKDLKNHNKKNAAVFLGFLSQIKYF